MARLRLVLPLIALGLAAPVTVPTVAFAQDRAATLADVRAQLGQLAGEFNSLKSELVAGGSRANVGGGDALQRMDAIEAELSRLTARAEEIELRLNRVVADGTNRLGDIEFRLCELSEGCDPMNLSQTSVLGGGSSAAPAPAATTAPSGGNAPQLAIAEQEDFDRAKGVLGQGDFRGAATLFETYAQSYPGGPLIPEAHYLRGDALAQLGDTANAGRAYLEAYSSNPQGTRAPDALLRLGQVLADLGQTPEACLTLAQVGVEYPAAPAAAPAQAAMQGLACR